VQIELIEDLLPAGVINIVNGFGSEAASEIVHKLQQTHGPLMFHLSGGCCDGSTPMCFDKEEFLVGSRDIQMGEIDDCPFYIAADTFTY
jgi:uncharacterized protein (DUF779 family)